MFWAIRMVVTLSVQFGGSSDFGGFIVINETFEIALLFVSILCFILIVKRKVLGAVIYIAGYAWYFGIYFVKTVFPILSEGNELDLVIIENIIAGVIAIVLGLCTMIDIAVERTKAKHFSDNKTDWYFGNDKYDRKYDDRADKNQYRTR